MATDDKIKIFTVAHVPPGLAQAWMQHLRDFDTANADCHFEVMTEGPDRPLQEIVQMMTVTPELKFSHFFKRPVRDKT